MDKRYADILGMTNEQFTVMQRNILEALDRQSAALGDTAVAMRKTSEMRTRLGLTATDLVRRDPGPTQAEIDAAVDSIKRAQ